MFPLILLPAAFGADLALADWLAANPQASVLIAEGDAGTFAMAYPAARLVPVPADADPEAALAAIPGNWCGFLVRPQAEGWVFQPTVGCATPGADAAPPPEQAPRPAQAPPRDPKKNAIRLANGFGTAYGAYLGGESGWLLGEALEDREGQHTGENIGPGVIGGAAIGGVTALLVSRNVELTPEQALLMYSGAFQGGFVGGELTRAVLPYDAPAAPERIQAGGMAGSIAGVGLGLALGRHARPVPDQLRTDLGLGIGWIAGTGVSDMLPKWWVDVDSNGDQWVDARPPARRRDAAIALGTGGALAGLALAANRVGVDDPTPATLALSFGHGTWIGAWAPLAFSDAPTTRQVTGGLRVGLGAGYASSLAMSAFQQPDARSAALQSAGWASASAIGAGIPLVASPTLHRRTAVGSMLASGVGGQLAGALIAPRWDFGDDDAALLATLETWTAVQAIGWGMYADATGAESHRALGGGLVAGGSGTAFAMALVPALDVAPSGSVMLFSGGAWGAWFGGWSAQLATGDADDVWLGMLVVGNAGLGATALAEGIGWRPSWGDVAVIDGLGLVGAAAGGLVGVVALYQPDDWDPLVTSTLVGSGVGLVAGGVIAARTPDGADTLAFAIPFHPRIPRRVIPTIGPWTTPEGGAGVLVTLDTVRE